MPKLKTHRGTAKRVRRTPSGKLLRDRAFGGHFLAKKSESRKRNIRHKAVLSGSIARKLKKVLGV